MPDEVKKILVTGAGGFLGYHMANFLSDQGYTVTGMDVHFPETTPDGSKPRFQTVHSDFRKWEVTKKALEGADIVYHFASAHLQISLDQAEYWDINVRSMPTLLKAAKAAGCKRFIHVSSVGAYGKLTEIPANEETVCHPQSTYGETKLAGEQEVISTCKELDLPFVILRPAWIYGLGCPRTAKLHRMLKKKRFIMIGKGLNKRHPMYIKDMLKAFRLAMDSDPALGETMIIGGDQIITTKELVETFSNKLHIPGPLITLPYQVGVILATVVETLFGILGKEPPLSRRTLEFFDTDNGFDVSKSKRLLAFTPQYSFQEGVEDYAEEFSRL